MAGVISVRPVLVSNETVKQFAKHLTSQQICIISTYVVNLPMKLNIITLANTDIPKQIRVIFLNTTL